MADDDRYQGLILDPTGRKALSFIIKFTICQKIHTLNTGANLIDWSCFGVVDTYIMYRKVLQQSQTTE